MDRIVDYFRIGPLMSCVHRKKEYLVDSGRTKKDSGPFLENAVTYTQSAHKSNKKVSRFYECRRQKRYDFSINMVVFSFLTTKYMV